MCNIEEHASSCLCSRLLGEHGIALAWAFTVPIGLGLARERSRPSLPYPDKSLAQYWKRLTLGQMQVPGNVWNPLLCRKSGCFLLCKPERFWHFIGPLPPSRPSFSVSLCRWPVWHQTKGCVTQHKTENTQQAPGTPVLVTTGQSPGSGADGVGAGLRAGGARQIAPKRCEEMVSDRIHMWVMCFPFGTFSLCKMTSSSMIIFTSAENSFPGLQTWRVVIITNAFR